MGVLKWIIILLTILIAYFIYDSRNVHPDIEERNFVLAQMPLTKIVDSYAKLSYYLGSKDIFMDMRIKMNILSFVNRRHSFPDVEMTEITISGVRVKMYAPKASHVKINTHRRSLIYFHGGGYAVGNPEAYHYILGHLCQETGLPVFAADYRKAPQHVYPAALDDSFRVTEFIQSNCQKNWNLDPERIYLAGDSAGGHLVAAVTLKLHERKLKRPERIILIYPILQLVSFSTPSYIENSKDFVLSKQNMVDFWLNYDEGKINAADRDLLMNNSHSTTEIRKEYATKFDLPELIHQDSMNHQSVISKETIKRFSHMYQDISVSPLLAKDLSHFPSTLIISSKFDVLYDDSRMMERRLSNAKVNVNHIIYNSFHGMLNTAPVYGPANRALTTIVDFLIK